MPISPLVARNPEEEHAAKLACFADCSKATHIDMEHGCCSMCRSVDECTGWVPYLSDIQGAEPAPVVRQFVNEHDREITIAVEGPSSIPENVLTQMEAQQVRNALNDTLPATTAETDLLFRSFLGLRVLRTMCEKAGLSAAGITEELLEDIIAAHPEFPARAMLR